MDELPERCPRCGGDRTIQRMTRNFGEKDEYSYLYCSVKSCSYVDDGEEDDDEA